MSAPLFLFAKSNGAPFLVIPATRVRGDIERAARVYEREFVVASANGIVEMRGRWSAVHLHQVLTASGCSDPGKLRALAAAGAVERVRDEVRRIAQGLGGDATVRGLVADVDDRVARLVTYLRSRA